MSMWTKLIQFNSIGKEALHVQYHTCTVYTIDLIMLYKYSHVILHVTNGHIYIYIYIYIYSAFEVFHQCIQTVFHLDVDEDGVVDTKVGM